MGGGIRHPPASTRGADAAAFTRKRQEPVVSAFLTPKTQETSRQDATVEEGSKFFFDETRHRMISFFLSAEERFQFLGHHVIEDRCFGTSRRILKGGVRHARQECRFNPGARANRCSGLRTGVAKRVGDSCDIPVTIPGFCRFPESTGEVTKPH
jgi:hypothetical protein